MKVSHTQIATSRDVAICVWAVEKYMDSDTLALDSWAKGVATTLQRHFYMWVRLDSCLRTK
jgi:hypothetical protein